MSSPFPASADPVDVDSVDGEEDQAPRGPEPAQVAKEGVGALFDAAVAETPGREDSMMDSFAVCDGEKSGCAFGVFDGFGGASCAQAVAKAFRDRYNDGQHPKCLQGIAEMCAAIDQEYLTTANRTPSARGLMRKTTWTKRDTTKSSNPDVGAEAACVFIFPDTRGDGGYKAVAANVGLLNVALHYADTGKTDAIAARHSPTHVSEAERIVAAGGWISDGKLEGTLATSRAFGAEHFKVQADDASKPQMVVTPTATSRCLRAGDMVLLASGGVYDGGMTPEAAFEVINAYLACDGKEGDYAGAAQAVCDTAVEEYGSVKNCTALLVRLRALPVPSKESWKMLSHLDMSLSSTAGVPEKASRKPAEKRPESRAAKMVAAKAGSINIVRMFATESPDFGFEVEPPNAACEYQVAYVRQNGPAWVARIRPGMWILTVNAEKMLSKARFDRALSRIAEEGNGVAEVVVRAPSAHAWSQMRRAQVRNARMSHLSAPGSLRAVSTTPDRFAASSPYSSPTSSPTEHRRAGYHGYPSFIRRDHSLQAQRSPRRLTSPAEAVRSVSPRRSPWRSSTTPEQHARPPTDSPTTDRNSLSRACLRSVTAELVQSPHGIHSATTLKKVANAKRAHVAPLRNSKEADVDVVASPQRNRLIFRK